MHTHSKNKYEKSRNHTNKSHQKTTQTSHKSVKRPPPNGSRHRNRRIDAQIPPKIWRSMLLHCLLIPTLFHRPFVPLQGAYIRRQREREPPLRLVGWSPGQPLLRVAVCSGLGLCRGSWCHVAWSGEWGARREAFVVSQRAVIARASSRLRWAVVVVVLGSWLGSFGSHNCRPSW